MVIHMFVKAFKLLEGLAASLQITMDAEGTAVNMNSLDVSAISTHFWKVDRHRVDVMLQIFLRNTMLMFVKGRNSRFDSTLVNFKTKRIDGFEFLKVSEADLSKLDPTLRDRKAIHRTTSSYAALTCCGKEVRCHNTLYHYFDICAAISETNKCFVVDSA